VEESFEAIFFTVIYLLKFITKLLLINCRKMSGGKPSVTEFNRHT
jgi:hypothetical protein